MNIPNLLLGRILFALPMLVFGFFHIVGADKMTGMVPTWIPGGVLWVYVSGLGLLAAGVAILLGKQVRLACQLLALMMIIFVVTIHLPGMMAGGDGAQLSLLSILKDTAIAGGALILAHAAE